MVVELWITVAYRQEECLYPALDCVAACGRVGRAAYYSISVDVETSSIIVERQAVGSRRLGSCHGRDWDSCTV